MKNFSSLKAIVSGLQSNAIYRLSKTWAALPREKLEIFNELARIFSEDNNAWAQREVLMREGTAKFADTTGENDRHLQKVFQKQVRIGLRPHFHHFSWANHNYCKISSFNVNLIYLLITK